MMAPPVPNSTDGDDDEVAGYFSGRSHKMQAAAEVDKRAVRSKRGRRLDRTHPAQPEITQHQREEEPQHEFTTEECVVEVENLRRRLTVVLCVRC